MDQFCDKSGTISPVRIQLSKQEKTLRGELIVRGSEVSKVDTSLYFSLASTLRPVGLTFVVQNKKPPPVQLNNYKSITLPLFNR